MAAEVTASTNTFLHSFLFGISEYLWMSIQLWKAWQATSVWPASFNKLKSKDTTFWYCFLDSMPGNKILYTVQHYWYSIGI